MSSVSGLSTGAQYAGAVFKKVQGAAEQNGRAALQLIEGAAAPAKAQSPRASLNAAKGQNLNVVA
ncbi:MAG: hypothetical protein AAGH15_00550 [Myxococcota bacterium]